MHARRVTKEASMRIVKGRTANQKAHSAKLFHPYHLGRRRRLVPVVAVSWWVDMPRDRFHPIAIGKTGRSV